MSRKTCPSAAKAAFRGEGLTDGLKPVPFKTVYEGLKTVYEGLKSVYEGLKSVYEGLKLVYEGLKTVYEGTISGTIQIAVH